MGIIEWISYPCEASVILLSVILMVDKWISEKKTVKKPSNHCLQTIHDPQSGKTIMQDFSCFNFLDELAKGTPTPGGGAAAAYAGASSAALVSMVAGLTIGKRKYAAVETEMVLIRNQSEQIRDNLTQAAFDDMAAFTEFISAISLPKETPDEIAHRSKQIRDAVLQTARIPLKICGIIIALIDLIVQAANDGNISTLGDAAAASYLANACFFSSYWNVRNNLNYPSISDQGYSILGELAEIKSNFDRQQEQLSTVFRKRGNFDLFF